MSALLSCPVCRVAVPPQDGASLRCPACGACFVLGVSTVPEESTQPFPGAATESPPRVAPPGYTILGELGRGGMGVVYRARHEKLRRDVALKMILAAGHAGTQVRSRFEAEAQAVARLQHPHIVQVFEIGEHIDAASGAALPFMALELCPGGSLDERLREQPPTPREAAELVATLALAMQAAHEAQVIHRDLKPANVLIAADGTLKVSDFGLARQLDEAGQTHTGAVMGTPSYMAPEQARGERDLGPAVDVYALGAILYCCLTGRPPFRAPTVVETLRQVTEGEAVAVRQLNPAVPRDLETICHKCLHKEPARRYASARELADDLGCFVRGEPIRARPVGRIERGWRWVRRNPLVAGLAAAFVTSLLAGLAFSIHYAREARAEATVALEQKAQADRSAHEANLQRYLAEMNLAAFAYRDGKLARTRDLLANWVSSADQPDRRGLEWAILQRQAQGALRVLEYRTIAVRTLAWHPSGRRLYFIHDNQLVGWDLEGEREVFRVPAPSTPHTLDVRPDGRQLALTADKRLFLLDADTGAIQFHGPPGPGGSFSAQYAPDGKSLVAAGGTRAIRRHDPATGAILQVFDANDGHRTMVRDVAHVGKEGHVVGFDFYGTMIRWNPTTGAPVWRVQVGPGVPQTLAVHPTRPLAALGYADTDRRGREIGRVALFDLERGEHLIDLADPGGKVLSVAFNPDGSLLATGGDDQLIRIWDVRGPRWDETHRPPQVGEFAGHDSPVARLAWSPDGWRLASTGDSTVRLWSMATSALERTWPAASEMPPGLVLHPRGDCVLLLGGDRPGLRVSLDAPLQELALPDVTGVPAQGDWSADGRWVAFAIDRHAEVRDGVSLRVVHTLKDHPNRIRDVRFTPAGDRLLTSCANGEIRIWDPASGNLVRSWKLDASTHTLAISPDGTHVAVLGGKATVFRMDTGEKVWEKPPEHPPSFYATATFLPDGMFVLGGCEGAISFFELPDEKPIRILQNTPRPITGLWAPGRGRRLLSRDDEGTLTIWDLETHQALRVLPVSLSTGSVAVDPAGRWLVHRTGDVYRLWDLRPLDEGLVRRQEAMAVVDHLARLCVDRDDLLRRVRAHPGLGPAIRAEALDLAGRYTDDAESLAREVFEVAWVADRPSTVYAAQMARAERAVRDLPGREMPLLARGTLSLRLGKLDLAAKDLQAAEGLFGERVGWERLWLWRLRALCAFRTGRIEEAKALAAMATKAAGGSRDHRDLALENELAGLLTTPAGLPGR